MLATTSAVPATSAMPNPRPVTSGEPSSPSMTEQLARRAVERTVAGRRLGYEHEMKRIVEATFELVRRTGTVDPPMRDILAETGLATQGFYRYFRSKDELMLALLDEGRRRLVATLERRMQRASTPAALVGAWIEGVLAQAGEAAASRTRPWVANEQRLAERFPEEHQSSVAVLVGLLEDPIRRLRGGDDGVAGAALAVYRLTFATLHAHLAQRTKPSPADVAEVVAFCVRGAGR